MLCFGVVIKMFADNAKLYAEIVTITDVNKRQSALDAIETLCVLTIFCCIRNLHLLVYCIVLLCIGRLGCRFHSARWRQQDMELSALYSALIKVRI